jgi:hypothetical protein
MTFRGSGTITAMARRPPPKLAELSENRGARAMALMHTREIFAHSGAGEVTSY